MGKRIMGNILELGPERSVGADNTISIFSTGTRTVLQIIFQPYILQCLLCHSIHHSPDDILRSQLFLRRYALVCVVSVAIKNLAKCLIAFRQIHLFMYEGLFNPQKNSGLSTINYQKSLFQHRKVSSLICSTIYGNSLNKN